MKTLLTFLLIMSMTFVSPSQELNIQTESVTIDNLLTFVIDYTKAPADSIQNKNTTFLIETYSESFTTEDKVILKQALRLFSNRSGEDDVLSVAMYSALNGIAVNMAETKDLKKLLYAIENPKSSIKTFEDDGIETAYAFTKENFIEDAENTVVMIRIPNRNSNSVVNASSLNAKQSKKKGNNAVVLTAIALLPEIIAVIKN